MTQDDVTQELNERNFPQILSSDAYTGITKAALRQLNRYHSQTDTSSFNTIAMVQDYYIFNLNDLAPGSDPTTATVPPAVTFTGTGGPLAAATEIRDVEWNPGGNFGTADIFDPTWAFLATNGDSPTGFVGGLVTQRELEIGRAYGSQGWQILGPIGNPSSFMRLFPLPREGGDKVIVTYEYVNTLDTINDGDDLFNDFVQWMCVYAAEALANYYSMTAGTQILGFTDSVQAMKYWQRKYDAYLADALSEQGGLHGEVDRYK